MTKLLLVEGLTDAAFFKALIGRLYGDVFEVAVENTEGKYGISDAVKAHLQSGVVELAVAQDIDDGPPTRVLQSVQGAAYSAFGLEPPGGPSTDPIITVEGRTVHVLAMGLYRDPTLVELGISRHALEDYVVKLALEDQGLQENVRELRTLLDQMLPRIREREGPFNSSKDIFQLVKPLIQHGFNDVGVVTKLVQDVDEGILRSVLSPLLPDLERALGV